MIRDKEKRLAWAREHKSLSFEDVIYMDKTTVQIEMHRRTCCYMKGQKPQYKPKPKHPVKVHVWAGISHRGRTNLCIFEGRWMLHCSSPSYVNHLCHSSMLCTPMGIASCRTITPSIVQSWQKPTTRRVASTGGPLHLSHPISTQSRTWFMALRLSGQLWQLQNVESTLDTKRKWSRKSSNVMVLQQGIEETN